jgi:hypothetical protein
MDQTKSDFWKMRSLAIKVAKDALEQGGFTLPEPLYRVRLEDRDGQLANQQMDSGTAARRVVPDSPDDTVLDVSPDTHIQEMVNDERSQSGDTDLLDGNRPIE